MTFSLLGSYTPQSYALINGTVITYNCRFTDNYTASVVNNVMVGAGAKILGAFEVGDNCNIAANAVLLKPLEENITAVGIPARPVRKDGVKLPQPQTMTEEHYCRMEARIKELEDTIELLKAELKRTEHSEKTEQQEK